MQISGSVALVTGANRGLGAQLVAELARRGATRVYATARRPEALAPVAAESPVVSLALDVDDEESVAAAARAASDVTLLVNNAGVLAFGDALGADLGMVDRDLRTNCLGTLRATQAFAPVIEGNGGGAVLNVLTLIALAPMPGMAAYCASKAAAHSITQSLRAELAERGIRVHGAYPAGIDTDMLAGVDGPKADPRAVAAALADGIEAGIEDITPDAVSADGFRLWRTDPKALEARFAGVG